MTAAIHRARARRLERPQPPEGTQLGLDPTTGLDLVVSSSHMLLVEGARGGVGSRGSI